MPRYRRNDVLVRRNEIAQGAGLGFRERRWPGTELFTFRCPVGGKIPVQVEAFGYEVGNFNTSVTAGTITNGDLALTRVPSAA